MAPPRSRRFPPNRKPKVDHSSYVQSLFREFLRRNQTADRKSASIPVQQPTTSKEDANRRMNPYRESIERMLQLQQQQVEPTFEGGQQSLVKQFFQVGKSNPPEKGPQRPGPPEPAYVRFKRREGSDQFVKRETSPGGAPAGGLIQWLEDRKRERLEREQRQQNRTKKVDEYLNLPDDFFSGRPSIKLPFELEPDPTDSTAANKTLASITSAFVPPVASTPLDQQFPAVCSPIISDPDEILTAVKVTVPKPKPIVKNEDFELIEKFITTIDSFSAILVGDSSDPVDRNYGELRRLRAKRPVLPKPSLPTEDSSSVVVQVQLGCDRKRTPSSSVISAGDSTFEREMMQLLATTPIRKKRPREVDPLLTYSPPAPKLDPDLQQRPTAPRNGPSVTLNTSFLTSNGSLSSLGGGESAESQPHDDPSSMVIRVQLGGDRGRTCQAHPSVSCLDSTFAREALQLTVPNEVRLRRLDPLLLYSPPFPKVEPKKKQICHREPDYSFLDSSCKATRLESNLRDRSQSSQGPFGSFLSENVVPSTRKQPDFAFDDDQENFGPIFPSQDGSRLGANTTIDFNESVSVEDPFELRFSQGSIWEQIQDEKWV